MRTFFTPHLGVFRFNHSSNSKIKLNKMLSYTAVFGWILFERKYKSPDERGFFRYILYQLGEKCELKTFEKAGQKQKRLYQLGEKCELKTYQAQLQARSILYQLGEKCELKTSTRCSKVRAILYQLGEKCELKTLERP